MNNKSPGNESTMEDIEGCAGPWRMAKSLWSDERAMHSPETMIVTMTITVIGSIVGLVTLRDHIQQQFGDAAVALDSLDQSFEYYFAHDDNGDGDFDDDGEFEFEGSYVDDSPTLLDADGVAPACLNFNRGPTSES